MDAYEILDAAGFDLESAVNGYLECQLWAGLNWAALEGDDDGNPEPFDDEYSIEDIDDAYVSAVRDEILDLAVNHPLAMRMYLGTTTVMGNMRNRHNSAQWGHDYYLTRERHGAGFWDRGLGELGEYWTEVSQDMGGADDLADGKYCEFPGRHFEHGVLYA